MLTKAPFLLSKIFLMSFKLSKAQNALLQISKFFQTHYETTVFFFASQIMIHHINTISLLCAEFITLIF